MQHYESAPRIQHAILLPRMSLAAQQLFTVPAQKIELNAVYQRELLQSFWPGLGNNVELEDHVEFFRFVDQTLSILSLGRTAFAMKTFQHLFDTIQYLRTHIALPKEDLVQELKRTRFVNAEDGKIVKSIELSVYLWLGISIAFSGGIGFADSRDYCIAWDRTVPLNVLTNACFSSYTTTLKDTAVEFDSLVYIVNLAWFRGVRVKWTHYLSDHLRLEGRPGKRILHIYQHKRILSNHQTVGSPFQDGLLKEALHSIDLLFPFGHEATRKFLEKQSKVSMLFEFSPQSDQALGLDDFPHFKYRLITLLNLAHGPPENLLQRLLDTSDMSQWMTLWIGILGILILTLLFGILSTIYAIKSYNVAVTSLDIAVKSYELSVILACQQDPRPAQLAAFCT